MRILFNTGEYALNNEMIQQAITEIDPLLEQEKIKKQNALRMRLTIEELLLRIKDSVVEIDSFCISMERRFGKTSIYLRYKGGIFDPTDGSDEDETWQTQILSNLGLAPIWSYRAGVNTVRLDLPKAGERSTLKHLLIAVAAAAVFGFAGNYLPEAVRLALDAYLLTPLFNAFLGMLSTLAGILIFLTVTSGVFGIGDTTSLNRIGKVTLSRFIATAFIVATIAVMASLLFFNLQITSGIQGESQIAGVSEMAFNILPHNLVRPYLEGNTMQIIVLAVFTGVVLVALGEKAKRVCALITDIGLVVQTMMGLVCRLIPYFVFVSLIKQIWAGSGEKLLSLWKPVSIFLLVAAAIILIQILMIGMRTGISPSRLIKEAFPAFLVGISTASSMAAFSTAEKDCVERMGISKKLFNFAFPVGMVMYMPGPAVEFTLASIFLAEQFGMEVSTSWYIMAGFLAAVLSIAVPPMPGAGMTCYGLLLAQLNIPAEAMLMAVALDVIFDFLCTGVDILMLQLELVYQADVLHMLDRDKLEKMSAG
ncbi:MAG: dicarboxylate/amino acid:cation symporter [Lachnospiraceae bacterium]|nr:dicarboxylate/amino acid:cation symporter [Lachnospiraceae bacterium]